MKKISIIGSGNVGRRIGEKLLQYGNDITFFDVNKDVINELLKKNLKATNSLMDAFRTTEISFLAVPTPLNRKNDYDLSYVKNACENCGKALKFKDSFHVFVLKSTVTPGVSEEIVIPTIEKYSKKKLDKHFGFVYNPEFLTVIEKTWTKDKSFCITSEKEGRIVLGEGKNKKAGDIIEKLYKPTNVPIFRTDIKTAEITKLVANNRLPLAISYSNEIFLFCKMLKKKGIKIDTDFVIKMVAMDTRIGKYGSVFGKAWGGPCFKKDTKAFRSFLKEKTRKIPKLIDSTIEINDEMNKKYGVRE